MPRPVFLIYGLYQLWKGEEEEEDEDEAARRLAMQMQQHHIRHGPLARAPR